MPKSAQSYSRFSQIDGKHDYRSAVKDGYVEYPVRKLKGGKVTYFNYELAAEMGLIPAHHPHEMNSALERAILETFAQQIVNEYDVAHDLQVPASELKPNTYMATRYLQLQHPDRRGTTSGDGRSIWNGQIRHQGVTWDISSCGTGATRLSPYHAIEGRWIKTGDTRAYYGNGIADIGEGVSAAIMSGIFHHNHVPTERTLTIIEFEGNRAINVRAGCNLLRPSHFFHHLRQENYKSLKATVDYYCDRQISNGTWPKQSSEAKKYKYFAEQMALTFARSAALFESEYIFVWLDWDGDNILADGGIIDYGSVRQFGLCHHRYRYDDGDRWSTRLTEQRRKAREIVQTFAQAIDYVLHGKIQKKSKFKNDPNLKIFDHEFDLTLDRLSLKKIGLSASTSNEILKKDRNLAKKFRTLAHTFERAFTGRRPYKVGDGETCDAIYSLRRFLRELPMYWLSNKGLPDASVAIEMLASRNATKRDLRMTPKKSSRVRSLIQTYQQIMARATEITQHAPRRMLLEVTMRSSLHNQADRITGDSVIEMTQELLKCRSTLSRDEFQKSIERVIAYQRNSVEDTLEIDSQSSDPVFNRVKLILHRHAESL